MWGPLGPLGEGSKLVPQGKFLSPLQSSERSVKDSEEKLGETGGQTSGQDLQLGLQGLESK